MNECKGIKMVAAGIDSLNVGFNINGWKLDEAAFKELEFRKGVAGEKLFGGKGVTVKLGGSEFNLLPKGSKGYEFVMYNEDLRLCLAKECQGGRVLPEVFAEFNSSLLWGDGYNNAYNKFKKWLSEWAIIESEKVNRVDMCVDLALDLPRFDVAKEVVTRGRNKVNYFQVEQYTSGRRDTGYRFGTGAVVARIYDKGYEIKASNKEWFYDIWEQGGWDGESGITRAEFQTRRDCLKDFGVNSYADMIERMPDMWRYLTGKWLVIKQPNPVDSNNRRWDTSPVWEAVQNAGERFGKCLGVQRWKQKQPEIDRLKAQAKGLIASIVAIDSTNRGEYFAISRLRSELDQYLDSAELQTKVLERRGRYTNLSSGSSTPAN